MIIAAAHQFSKVFILYNLFSAKFPSSNLVQTNITLGGNGFPKAGNSSSELRCGALTLCVNQGKISGVLPQLAFALPIAILLLTLVMLISFLFRCQMPKAESTITAIRW